MFKRISLIFLFSATALLLAHALVPHSHHSEGGEINIKSYCSHHESNLLGLLASAFHLDLGNDHLKNLKPASNQSVGLFAALVLSVVAFDFKFVVVTESKNYTYPPIDGLVNPYLLSPKSRRGPPAV